MFGFLESDADFEVLSKAINEWIPRALKKTLGQTNDGKLNLPDKVEKDVFINIQTVMRNVILVYFNKENKENIEIRQ